MKSSTVERDLVRPENQPDRSNADVLDRLGLVQWLAVDHQNVARSHQSHLSAEMIGAKYNFHGVEIECPAGIYHPAVDSSSLFLLRHISAHPNDHNPNVIEIGVGSGAVLLALAKRWGAGSYTGIDISSEAIDVAKRNAHRNGISADLRQSDLFADVSEQRFDAVLFNPPLYDKPAQSRIEQETLCDPGGRLLRRFLDQLGDHLAPRGSAHLVVSNIGCLAPLSDCKLNITLAGAELFANGMVRAVIRLEHHDVV